MAIPDQCRGAGRKDRHALRACNLATAVGALAVYLGASHCQPGFVIWGRPAVRVTSRGNFFVRRAEADDFDFVDDEGFWDEELDEDDAEDQGAEAGEGATSEEMIQSSETSTEIEIPAAYKPLTKADKTRKQIWVMPKDALPLMVQTEAAIKSHNDQMMYPHQLLVIKAKNAKKMLYRAEKDIEHQELAQRKIDAYNRHGRPNWLQDGIAQMNSEGRRAWRTRSGMQDQRLNKDETDRYQRKIRDKRPPDRKRNRDRLEDKHMAQIMGEGKQPFYISGEKYINVGGKKFRVRSRGAERGRRKKYWR